MSLFLWLTRLSMDEKKQTNYVWLTTKLNLVHKPGFKCILEFVSAIPISNAGCSLNDFFTVAALWKNKTKGVFITIIDTRLVIRENYHWLNAYPRDGPKATRQGHQLNRSNSHTVNLFSTHSRKWNHPPNIDKHAEVFLRNVRIQRMTVRGDKMAFLWLRREHSSLFKVPQHDSTVWDSCLTLCLRSRMYV